MALSVDRLANVAVELLEDFSHRALPAIMKALGYRGVKRYSRQGQQISDELFFAATFATFATSAVIFGEAQASMTLERFLDEMSRKVSSLTADEFYQKFEERAGEYQSIFKREQEDLNELTMQLGAAICRRAGLDTTDRTRPLLVAGLILTQMESARMRFVKLTGR